MTEVTPAVQHAIHWGDVATWIGAIATFLAVLVALRLHVKFFPPRLELRLFAEGGKATPVTIQTIEAGTVVDTRSELGRYYHVELRNRRPLVTATNPVVYIVAVSVPDASGREFAEVWTGAVPMTATYYGVHPSRTLGADPQLYDLCSVVRGKWLELHPQIRTLDFPARHRVAETDKTDIKTRVALQARSLESVSPRTVFEIAWDGDWSDDAHTMRRHMVVRQL